MANKKTKQLPQNNDNNQVTLEDRLFDNPGVVVEKRVKNLSSEQLAEHLTATESGE